MRLFLDANVVFSAAHNPAGNARALFMLAGLGHCALLASRYAIEEASRNIALKFPDCGPELTVLISRLVVVPEPSTTLVKDVCAAGLPEKDAPILAAAIASRAEVLVTGDRRHFGAFYGATLQGVLILPPAEGLNRVLDQTVPKP